MPFRELSSACHWQLQAARLLFHSDPPTPQRPNHAGFTLASAM
jgi:hypothetical protein